MILSSRFSVELDYATNGKEALDKVLCMDQAAGYDIVFMDWNMPIMNGVDASKRIKIMYE
jgi:CheY-like chemotaxis protein